MAADAAGDLYIVDGGGPRVLKVAADSGELTETPIDGLSRAVDVAVGSNGFVYIADSRADDDESSEVWVLMDGGPAQLNTHGLNNIHSVAAMPDGTLYATDTEDMIATDRLLKLSEQTTEWEVVDNPRDDSAFFADEFDDIDFRPSYVTSDDWYLLGIAVDQKRDIYLACSRIGDDDKHSGKVIKLGPDGSVDDVATGIDGFLVGVAVNAGGDIYMSDEPNNRILVKREGFFGF
ncbi:hypothetical protein [Mycolicibacterium brumae]|uniref:Uncharacterized protein n=1 Tax=Mycolicibacterium brumae TaxID=85968 RepID=A0A2G5P8X7_9MYCO|nr:hypothetical protein [Mycolicibacterium brumae]MCV7193403.1 hypothetical protein [Mycolicibacterium brumae]PIB74808.1 hypothetical protein CQY22_011855 [Mycolicibacterium brumae]RWA22270.1 hypothetical protein MBRU_13335 [Mycolicibacterium brumae DSM 44177]UWW07228.1 hypothetical protein L2Z93_000226 [Mycolicibacterium brumae]